MNHSGFAPVSSLSRKILENAGYIIPISDEIKVVRITNVIAAPAPFNPYFANETTLYGLKHGSKFSDGSNIRQMPVNELSNVSIDTE